MARQLAFQLGVRHLPLAVIPHPVGDHDEDVVRRRAEVAVDQAIAALTSTVDELAQDAGSFTVPGPVCLERTKTRGG